MEYSSRLPPHSVQGAGKREDTGSKVHSNVFIRLGIRDKGQG